MNIRTLAQLPEIAQAASAELRSSKFEASVKDNSNRYTSKSYTYSILSSQLSTDMAYAVGKEYNLMNADGTVHYNVGAINKNVNDISAQPITFYGRKTFAACPQLTSTVDPSNNQDFITLKKTNELLNARPEFAFSVNNFVRDGNPFYRASTTVEPLDKGLGYDDNIPANKFYFWQIDDQENDSSTSNRDRASGSVDGYEEMRSTGNLVVWGWLADNGDVRPEAAWVALMAKMKFEGSTAENTADPWVPISVKPWIVGSNSSLLQYVSFNVPVKTGLQLKIRTGFNVNGTSGGGFQNPGTLTFIDRWIPNAFFGYIIG